jgi:hypothetical protein
MSQDCNHLPTLVPVVHPARPVLVWIVHVPTHHKYSPWLCLPSNDNARWQSFLQQVDMYMYLPSQGE